MRRQLWALAALLLPTTAGAAWACSSGPRPSVEELYAGAAIVFLGHLVRVEEIATGGSGETPPPKPPLVATFEIIEVFKGKPPARGIISVPAPDSCDSPPLLVALDHVLFLNDQSSIRSRHEAMFVYDPPNDDIVGERKRLLDKLRSLSEQQPK